MTNKIDRLIAYAKAWNNAADKLALYNQYKEDIESVTPMDVFDMQSKRLEEQTADELVDQVGMLVTLFSKALMQYPHDTYIPNGFIDTLEKENNEAEKRFTAIQVKLAQKMDWNEVKTDIITLTQYETHLAKLENIVYPYLEAQPRYKGVTILWSLSNRAKKALKTVLQNPGNDNLRIELGDVYLYFSTLLKAQKLILLPILAHEISPDVDKKLLTESFDYGFPFITPPEKPEIDEKALAATWVDLGTGRMQVKQIVALFSHLPVDVTFVDENDKVAFFSNPKHRIFPRSKSVIGRDVRNCHPAGSVHIVEKILSSFKANEKDSEKFWLQMRGMFVLIQYFAVRDEDGKYMGCLEVSQEVSDIRALEGEKRLLEM